MDRPRLLVFLRATLLFGLAEAALRLFGIGRTVELFGAHLGAAGTGTPGRSAPSQRAPSQKAPSVTGTDAGGLDSASRPGSLSPDEVAILAVLERIGRRWPFGPRGGCLRQSLAAAHVLRRRHPCIRIAVGGDTRRGLAAHSWVEIDGNAVTAPGALDAVLNRPGKARTRSGLA